MLLQLVDLGHTSSLLDEVGIHSRSQRIQELRESGGEEKRGRGGRNHEVEREKINGDTCSEFHRTWM